MGLDTKLLNVLGREYVIEHCAARHQEIKEQEMRSRQTVTYMVYTSDILREIAENTGAWVGRDYHHLPRWVEMMEEKPEDNRTAEEVAADVIQRAGLTLVTTGDQDDGCI